MSLILHIETATEVCSIVLAQEGRVISVVESYEPRIHASMTSVFIKEVMDKAGVSFPQLDAIAISRGPGSYTGLRIGVSTAKGLCFALDKPLIAVDTLKAMAGTFLLDEKNPKTESLLVPMIDARRMEVYGAVLDKSFNYIEPVKAEILSGNSFMSQPEKPRILFGDGAAKAIELFADNVNVSIGNSFRHSARGMVCFALNSWNTKQFEDVAYFEPYYLKEFMDSGKKSA
jgi:tRNA threonylcarbamoyladenosine biosynthesis protein TsaB